MTSLARYAPTVDFHLDRGAETLTGFAAPASGARPCLLQLRAGEQVIHAARATRYSSLAATQGVRVGWCGFEIPGAARGFAFASEVTVLCGVSERVLATLTPHDFQAPTSATANRTMTVEQVIECVRADTAATTINQIGPFADSFLHRVSTTEFIEASYVMLLGQHADPDTVRAIEARTPRTASSLLEEILLEVDRKRALKSIPGPFSPSFRYGLEILG